MIDTQPFLIDCGIILILFAGISKFRTPTGARFGNLLAAFALICALGVVLYRNLIMDMPLVIGFVVVGAVTGWIVARRMNMIQIPAMVAFQHGAGGVAVLLVSFIELTRETGISLSAAAEISGILGLSIGAATFSASMIASGKLANLLKQTPTVLPAHNLVLLFIIVSITLLGFVAGGETDKELVQPVLVLSMLISMAMGIVFSIRVGGADMPVLISFLNATAGLAAAFCGVVIENRLLIACGATVAASGSILTYIMCQAMNRNLFNVLIGIHLEHSEHALQTKAPPNEDAEAGTAKIATDADNQSIAQSVNSVNDAINVAMNADSIVIVPGYGMALSEAEFEVVQLGEKLEQLGKKIRYAVHPVAGRMPGHMHVLLAEADVDYDKLCEIDEINPEFCDTDLVFVIGACDVVNPAALENLDTPISGMPILLAHEANRIIVCNLDEKPGYSGVDNPLYKNPKTILLLGDARNTISQILAGISSDPLSASAIS